MGNNVGDHATFTVYPSFVFLIGRIFLLLLPIYLFLQENLLLQLVGVFLFFIFSIEFLLQYLIPLQVKINTKSKMLWYRDLSVSPTFLIKDDYRDQIASCSPFKSIPIERLIKTSFTTNMPELKTRMCSLFPINKRIGGKFSFHLTNNESIDLYVGVWDLYRHKKAFFKIAAFLHIPFEIQK